MESITKPPVSEDQLWAIARKHLNAEPVEVRELKEGWFNAAFLIAIPDGRFVLKIAPPDSVKVLRYEHNLMAAEVGAMRQIKLETNLPIPRIVAFDQSRMEVDNDYFIADCVRGLPLAQVTKDFSPEARAEIDRQVGGFLKELHGLTGSGFGTYNDPSFSTWQEAFTTFLDYLKRDRQDQDIEVPSNAFTCADPHLDALKEVQTPRLIHWDLWDPNVFVDPEGMHVTGLIDFERAMWADPLMEGNFMEPSPAFLEGYGLGITESDGAKARRALYNLHLSLIMVIESTYRHFTADHEKMSRDFLDRSIAGLLALP
jgi:aminoglycoside phosphotransferase (APT) family kinase protein